MGIAAVFSAMGSLVSAAGSYAAGQHQAQQAATRAKVGRIQADQIDTQYREDLQSTLSSIKAIRAVTGVNIDSPTSLALEQRETKVSDRNRTRDVASRRVQANQDEADARFFKSSAKFSLLGGVAQSLPYFFGS